jgi:hypothetical protein
METNSQKNSKKMLMQYAGFAFQLFVGLGLLLFLGKKTDDWQSFKTPIFTWVLPLLYITVIIIKAIKDTNPKHEK